MVMKKYKIYRWAYVSQVEEVIVPNNTVFHILESSDFAKDTEYGKVSLYSYVAVIPYTVDNWKLLNDSEGQSLAIHCYNVADEHIIIVLANVFALDPEFPLSKEKWNFPVSYITLRAIHQIKNTDKSLKEILKLSKEEQEKWFEPIFCYIKIHGVSKTTPSKLDATFIYVNSWIENRKVLDILREDRRIEDIFKHNNFIKPAKSSYEEFNKAFRFTLEQMY